MDVPCAGPRGLKAGIVVKHFIIEIKRCHHHAAPFACRYKKKPKMAENR